MANYGIGYVTFYSPIHNYIAAVKEAALISHQQIEADFYRFAEILYDGTTMPDRIVVDGRDTIYHVSDEIDYDEEHKIWSMQIGFEFAWEIHPDVFSKICDDIFDHQVKYVYTGTESCGDYFVNTDTEGLFYPDRYIAEISIGNSDTEEEEFRTKEQLVLWLREILSDFGLSVEINTSLSAKEIEDRIRQACDDQDMEYNIICVAEYEQGEN